MTDAVLRHAALLTTAGLFGGMLLFAGGFAAFLFEVLPVAAARALIRKAFPAPAAIALTTVPARQVSVRLSG